MQPPQQLQQQQPGADGAGTRDQQPRVCFDACKKEQLLPTKGFKQLHRKLKQFARVDLNKEDIVLEKLLPHDLYIIGTPHEPFTDSEMRVLHEYMDMGGSVLLTLAEGGGGRFTHLNKYFEEHFGIATNEDCVVRTVLHKYFHPKEVCVTNGVTNREINRAAGKAIVGGAKSTETGAEAAPSSLSFVYPHGLTLNVQRPGVPILSSGFMAYPLNRPIAAVWESNNLASHNNAQKRGKLMVIGTGLLLEDAWIGKEENDKLASVLLDYLLHQLKLNQIDADDPEITDYHHLPDTASLSERLRVSVEEREDLPRDFTQLFETGMFKFDTDAIPEVVETCKKLNMKHEPLTLIAPEFQAPLPPCLPATFEPTHREPPPPSLDLFDLDEHFASERVRLSQLTNKCQSEDLEFFITESAEIMGVTKKLRSPRNKDPRALLDHIFRQVLQYKKQAADGGGAHGGAQGGAQGGVGAANLAAMMGGGADGGSMTRMIRVVASDDGTVDLAPFDNNAPWSLSLRVDFAQGTIGGRLQLQGGSMNYQPQSCVVAGGVDLSGQSEFPLEWAVELINMMGEPVRFTFRGVQQGHTLRGNCVYGDTSCSFMYMVEDSP